MKKITSNYQITEAKTYLTGLLTHVWGDTYGVAAMSWANAANPVYSLGEDNEWVPTKYQVADFRHDKRKALRRNLEEIAVESGYDPEDKEVRIEIDIAVNRAKPFEDTDDND